MYVYSKFILNFLLIDSSICLFQLHYSSTAISTIRVTYRDSLQYSMIHMQQCAKYSNYTRIQNITSGAGVLPTYFTKGHTDLPREAIGPSGPIASRGGSVPIFQRKPLATYDFPGRRGPTPLPCTFVPPSTSIVR